MNAGQRTSRRLPAVEARRRILEAAADLLAEVGPEGLRLAEVAARVGVSHPAVLHHFGSRDALVRAAVAHALTRLNAAILESLGRVTAPVADAEALLAAAAAALDAHARSLAFVLLHEERSGRGDVVDRLLGGLPLGDAVEAVQALRAGAGALRAEAGPPSSSSSAGVEDAGAAVELAALALLGHAVFGRSVRAALGRHGAPAGETWRFLAEMLGARLLGAAPADEPRRVRRDDAVRVEARGRRRRPAARRPAGPTSERGG